eukprot:2585982-Lingulodinium_polyedra.AAC.1
MECMQAALRPKLDALGPPRLCPGTWERFCVQWPVQWRTLIRAFLAASVATAWRPDRALDAGNALSGPAAMASAPGAAGVPPAC